MLASVLLAVMFQGPRRPLPPVSEAYVVRMKWDPVGNPMPIVYARIGESEPLPFVLDTGAPVPVVLDTATAKKLKLELGPEVKQNGLSTYPASLPSLGIQGTDGTNKVNFGQNIPAYVTDMSRLSDALLERPVGFIGLSTMLSATIMLDYQKGEVAFYPAGDRLEIAGATRAAITVNEQQAICTVPVSFPSAGTLMMRLDTGSRATSVRKDLQKKLNPVATTQAWGGTLYGEAMEDVHLVRGIKIGSLALGDLCVTESAPIGPSDIGLLLGSDVLSRFITVIDFPNQELHLKPNGAKPIELGAPDVNARAKDGKLVVTNIRAGSPAERAGLKVGAVLKSIDGRPVAGMGDITATRLVNGLAGTGAKVSVMMGSETKDVTFQRAGFFAK